MDFNSTITQLQNGHGKTQNLMICQPSPFFFCALNVKTSKLGRELLLIRVIQFDRLSAKEDQGSNAILAKLSCLAYPAF